ncbi:MAG TPA: ion channel [Candidatus Eisenbacteria bacterium]|nr:ion channel [Candidatus Eisenbacteria bacterium]
MLVAMVVVQALAITAISRFIHRETEGPNGIDRWLHNIGVIVRTLLLLAAAQLVQIAAWAELFIRCGEFDGFTVALYHSAMNFTTLGDSGVVMSPAWRLLAPLEALAGMLMFGVSGAVLFSVIQTLIRLRTGHRLL